MGGSSNGVVAIWCVFTSIVDAVGVGLRTYSGKSAKLAPEIPPMRGLRSLDGGSCSLKCP